MRGAESPTGAETLRLQPMPQTDSPLLNKDGLSGAGDAGGAELDDYDPHKYRQLENPTNNLETLVHLIKCSLGTGILAMPQAFARAGLVLGALATVALAVIVTHSLHVLVRSQYWACKRARVPQLAYPAAMAACLQAGPPPAPRAAQAAAKAVDIFLVFYQLGICCVYIVFIADNVKKVVDPVYVMPVEAHMAIFLLPLMGFNLIRNLKLLAPFSALANVLTLVGLAIVVYYLLTEPSRRHHELDLWGDVATFPLFFGTVLFALTAVGVVIALESNMATPAAFGAPCGVLNTGMAFIAALYVGVGVAGYLYCGAACSDSVTLDLPVQRDALATSALVMLVIAIFISYGLHCYVPVEVVWKGYVKPRLEARRYPHLLRAEYALRTALCLLTFVLAASVPRLGLFISLCGALCLSALGICFPAIMELCAALLERSYIKAAKDVLLFIIGIVGLLAGTYTSLVSIVQSFSTASIEAQNNSTQPI